MRNRKIVLIGLGLVLGTFLTIIIMKGDDFDEK